MKFSIFAQGFATLSRIATPNVPHVGLYTDAQVNSRLLNQTDHRTFPYASHARALNQGAISPCKQKVKISWIVDKCITHAHIHHTTKAVLSENCTSSINKKCTDAPGTLPVFLYHHSRNIGYSSINYCRGHTNFNALNTQTNHCMKIHIIRCFSLPWKRYDTFSFRANITNISSTVFGPCWSSIGMFDSRSFVLLWIFLVRPMYRITLPANF